MKRTVTTATVSVLVLTSLSLAGCVADPSDAVPASTTPRSTSTAPSSTPSTNTANTGSSIPQRVRPGNFGSSRLSFFGDCPQLLGYLQKESLDRVTAWGLGGGGRYYPMAGDVMKEAASAPSARDSSVGGDGAPATTAPAYSGTNTQEVGVDEGDMVETNGVDVFVAGQDGVRIIDVAGARVVATLDVPAGSHQLLLDGTRLLVVTQPYTGTEDTITSLYDVVDPANPQLVLRSHLEGRLVASRSIDGRARLVLTSTLAQRLPFVYPEQFGLDETRALAANEAVIRNSSIEDWLPRYFDETGDGSFGAMSASLDCSTVAAPRDFAGLGISWIASIDMRGGASPVGDAGVVSYGETVYASPTNIYLATVPWDWTTDGGATNTQPPTLIHQFALDASGGASYVASGEVEGRLLNQFAMSEFEGDLRVATTLDNWNGQAQSESFVKVLRPSGDELVQVGSLGGLGRGEQIYAVRFLGAQAYVVTFRQTDPLYVVDLADPSNPVLSGELHMPGYSAYLHPVGDGLLLGVGQNADLAGRTTGTQLSLFDVSDPSNPVLLSTLPIGGYSDAEWDHHAFLYWPEDGTIVIPVSPSWNACAAEIGCLADKVTSPAGGVVVAQLQGRELVARGAIQHQATSDSGCWNPLQRSLVIGSEIVTIGFDQVQFTDRDSLVRRDRVRWGTADQYGCYYWMGG
jgi:hypothetical protein